MYSFSSNSVISDQSHESVLVTSSWQTLSVVTFDVLIVLGLYSVMLL